MFDDAYVSVVDAQTRLQLPLPLTLSLRRTLVGSDGNWYIPTNASCMDINVSIVGRHCESTGFDSPLSALVLIEATQGDEDGDEDDRGTPSHRLRQEQKHVSSGCVYIYVHLLVVYLASVSLYSIVYAMCLQ